MAVGTQSGGQNQKWSTYGQIGDSTLAVYGGPQRFRAGDKIRSGPQVGLVATSPLPSGGSPTLQSAGQNQQWEVFLFFGVNRVVFLSVTHFFVAVGRVSKKAQVTEQKRRKSKKKKKRLTPQKKDKQLTPNTLGTGGFTFLDQQSQPLFHRLGY